MSFLLDTNTCSAAMREDRRLFNRFVQYMGRLFTSRIVLVELYDWVLAAVDQEKRMRIVTELLEDVQMLEFDEECTMEGARLRRWLREHGKPIPEMDVLIAATARVHDFTLVTRNTRDFADMPGLRVVDWLL